ncbi:MAG: hypothetical protein KC457_37680, partial [Myxococcales bacterium]|nr:hypothetical protein [Myxococcales bacterium]
LAFPCNQFGNQEPGSNAEILEFARSKYGVSFPMHAKIDVNGDGTDGCECQGTDRTKSIEVCGDSMAGSFGTVAEGATLDNLVVGTIPALDNGVGNGAEDWYWVEFPEQMANGTRPNAGINKIYFAQNDGSDYRFELYRECGGDAWAGSLAKEFGDGAPPALEWWFQD